MSSPPGGEVPLRSEAQTRAPLPSVFAKATSRLTEGEDMVIRSSAVRGLPVEVLRVHFCPSVSAKATSDRQEEGTWLFDLRAAVESSREHTPFRD